MHAFDRQTDRQTDGQTDRNLIVRPRCIPCSAVIKLGSLCVYSSSCQVLHQLQQDEDSADVNIYQNVFICQANFLESILSMFCCPTTRNVGYDTIRKYAHKTTTFSLYPKQTIQNITSYLMQRISSIYYKEWSLCTKYIHITHYNTTRQLFTQNMTTPSNSTFFVTTATENISVW